MTTSIIAALANNNIIGNNNQLPWRLPADLRYFKAKTIGKPIVMGRKTYESLGKPLKDRRNIVVTRDLSFIAAGCEIVNSIEEALQLTQNVEETMIIGGATIYAAALPYSNRMYLTFIHQDFQGDTYFPQWNNNEWREIQREEHAADTENPYAYSFVILERTQGTLKIR